MTEDEKEFLTNLLDEYGYRDVLFAIAEEASNDRHYDLAQELRDLGYDINPDDE